MEEAQIQAFDDAQRRTLRLASALVAGVETGTSTRSLRELATALLSSQGFIGWRQPPVVAVGGRTSGSPFWRRLPSPRRVVDGDLLFFSLSPTDGRAWGDLGLTICHGGSDPELVELARQCTMATCGYATHWKCMGEVFVFARAWAANHRLTLVNQHSIGEDILPQSPTWAGPALSRRLTPRLRRNQVHFLNPRPMAGLVALGPHVSGALGGACFREVVVVSEQGRRLLGRGRLEDAGRLPAP